MVVMLNFFEDEVEDEFLVKSVLNGNSGQNEIPVRILVALGLDANEATHRDCKMCGEPRPVDDFSTLAPSICIDCSEKVLYDNPSALVRLEAYSKSTLPPINAVRVLLTAVYKVCCKCGSKGRPSVDHIVPLSMGGEHEWDNLQLLCKKCNTSKGNREQVDYRGFTVTLEEAQTRAGRNNI